MAQQQLDLVSRIETAMNNTHGTVSADSSSQSANGNQGAKKKVENPNFTTKKGELKRSNTSKQGQFAPKHHKSGKKGQGKQTGNTSHPARDPIQNDKIIQDHVLAVEKATDGLQSNLEDIQRQGGNTKEKLGALYMAINTQISCLEMIKMNLLPNVPFCMTESTDPSDGTKVPLGMYQATLKRACDSERDLSKLHTAISKLNTFSGELQNKK